MYANSYAPQVATGLYEQAKQQLEGYQKLSDKQRKELLLNVCLCGQFHFLEFTCFSQFFT